MPDLERQQREDLTAPIPPTQALILQESCDFRVAKIPAYGRPALEKPLRVGTPLGGVEPGAIRRREVPLGAREHLGGQDFRESQLEKGFGAEDTDSHRSWNAIHEPYELQIEERDPDLQRSGHRDLVGVKEEIVGQSEPGIEVKELPQGIQISSSFCQWTESVHGRGPGTF